MVTFRVGHPPRLSLLRRMLRAEERAYAVLVGPLRWPVMTLAAVLLVVMFG
jgi:hypothetical protein